MNRFNDDIPEPAAVCLCAHCYAEIRNGDEVTRFENEDTVHENCESEYVRDRLIYARGIIDRNGYVN